MNAAWAQIGRARDEALMALSWFANKSATCGRKHGPY